MWGVRQLGAKSATYQSFVLMMRARCSSLFVSIMARLRRRGYDGPAYEFIIRMIFYQAIDYQSGKFM